MFTRNVFADVPWYLGGSGFEYRSAIGFHDRGFSWFSSVPEIRFWYDTLKQATIYRSQFTNNPHILRYVTYAVKEFYISDESTSHY